MPRNTFSSPTSVEGQTTDEKEDCGRDEEEDEGEMNEREREESILAKEHWLYF